MHQQTLWFIPPAGSKRLIRGNEDLRLWSCELQHRYLALHVTNTLNYYDILMCNTVISLLGNGTIIVVVENVVVVLLVVVEVNDIIAFIKDTNFYTRI